MNSVIQPLASFWAHYASHPAVLLALFALASILMIWRLHAMENKGFEGTVLGTLIMPYCSGFANLVFAFVMSRSGGKGTLVVENALVNNVTNLTLILGLTALLSAQAPALASKSGKGGKGGKSNDVYRLYRLDLLFTLIALFLFTGTLWALAKDGVIDFYDGLVLVGLFAFWQMLHVFEVLKTNVRKNRSIHWSIVIDFVLIGVCAWCIYQSVDHLVQWVESSPSRYIGTAQLGWLSGMLMVLPNALLALYFARVGRQDIVVSSQVGDGHMCIPMCLGLFALSDSITVPAFFELGIVIIAGAGVVHFLSMAIFGHLPRLVGVVLLAGYAFFMVRGLTGS